MLLKFLTHDRGITLFFASMKMRVCALPTKVTPTHTTPLFSKSIKHKWPNARFFSRLWQNCAEG